MSYGFWKLLKFENCQSWKNKTIELSPGLNVLEAMSETGKSVFIKCLRLGLDYDNPKYTPKKKRSIVRDWDTNPHNTAVFSIMTSERYIVSFQFTIKTVTTMIIYPDRKVVSYKGPAKEDAKQILGLVTCDDDNRIINVLDNEDSLLFSGTSVEYGESLLGQYITHKALKTALKTANVNLDYYRVQLQRAKQNGESIKADLLETPKFYNLDYVESSVPKIEYNLNKIDYLERVYKYLDSYYKTSFKEEVDVNRYIPIQKKLNFNQKLILLLSYHFSIDYKNTLDTNLDNLVKRLSHQKALLELLVSESNTIYKAVIDLDLSKQQLKLEALQRVLSILAIQLNIDTKETISQEQSDLTRSKLKNLSLKKDLINSLLKQHNVDFKKVLTAKEQENLADKIRKLNYIKSILFALCHHMTLVIKFEQSHKKYMHFCELRSELLNILEYCPLCGSKITGGDSIEHSKTHQ